jgi:hypothetical protein
MLLFFYNYNFFLLKIIAGVNFFFTNLMSKLFTTTYHNRIVKLSPCSFPQGLVFKTVRETFTSYRSSLYSVILPTVLTTPAKWHYPYLFLEFRLWSRLPSVFVFLWWQCLCRACRLLISSFPPRLLGITWSISITESYLKNSPQ